MDLGTSSHLLSTLVTVEAHLYRQGIGDGAAAVHDAAAAVAERDRLRDALERIGQELGVPTPDYPAPVANAYEIVVEALS